MNRLNECCQRKETHDVEKAKYDILALLLDHAERIFEVGCGTGNILSFALTSAWFHQRAVIKHCKRNKV